MCAEFLEGLADDEGFVVPALTVGVANVNANVRFREGGPALEEGVFDLLGEAEVGEGGEAFADVAFFVVDEDVVVVEREGHVEVGVVHVQLVDEEGGGGGFVVAAAVVAATLVVCGVRAKELLQGDKVRIKYSPIMAFRQRVADDRDSFLLRHGGEARDCLQSEVRGVRREDGEVVFVAHDEGAVVLLAVLDAAPELHHDVVEPPPPGRQ